VTRKTFVFLIIAAACVCFALGLSTFAHCQTAPAAAQPRKSAQPTLADIGIYRLFIKRLGEEDEEIQRQTQDGKPPAIGRQDYATDIGISEGEEQTMLAIFIDAYYQGGGGNNHQNMTRYKLVQQYGPDEGQRMFDEEASTYLEKGNSASKEAVVKLQTQLGKESFAKLDKYIAEEGWRKGGKWWEVGKGWMIRDPSAPDPSPPNDNPPPGQTTHAACSGFYAQFFNFIATSVARNRMAVENNQAEVPTGFFLSDSLVKGTKQAVIDLAVETDRAITENDHKYRAAANEFRDQSVAKYGFKIAHEMPDPPKIEALNNNRWTMLEESIFKLKQIVGEDYFNQLDADLSKEKEQLKNKISAPSDGAPFVQQTPAVKP